MSPFLARRADRMMDGMLTEQNVASGAAMSLVSGSGFHAGNLGKGFKNGVLARILLDDNAGLI